MSDGELGRWRANHVGFVFQMYNLLPVLTAERNVELPLLLTKLSAAERRKRADAALSLVGLSERAKHKPRELSGGQEQRVGIARAIVSDPTLLLCDEPTGDLDRKSGDEILDLLQALNQQQGKTIIMVTHDPHAAARAKHVLHLNKGQLTREAAGLRTAPMFKYPAAAVGEPEPQAAAHQAHARLDRGRVPAVRPVADAARRAHRQRRSRRRRSPDHDAQGLVHPVAAAELSESHPRRRRRARDARTTGSAASTRTIATSSPCSPSTPDVLRGVHRVQAAAGAERSVADRIAPAPSSARCSRSASAGRSATPSRCARTSSRKKDGGNVWQMKIAGIYNASNGDNQSIYFHYDYLNESRTFGTRHDRHGSSMRLKDPNRSAEIARTIDAMFANSSTETKTSTERRSCRASPTRWATSARS